MVLTSAERRRLDDLAGELARENPRLARALTGRWYWLRRICRTLAIPRRSRGSHVRALGCLAVVLSMAAAPLLIIGALIGQPIVIAVGAVAMISGSAVVAVDQLRHARRRGSNPWPKGGLSQVQDAAPRDGDEVRQARTSDGEPIDPGLARDLSELARALQTEADPQTTMQRIIDATVDEIDGATAAAITLLEQGKITSPVHTSYVATRLGQAQVDTGEGPCVDTSREEITIRADDLRTDSRWPNFGPVAVGHGVLSMLSFQLFVEGDSMGALDVYADRAGAFDRTAENVGLLLAAHAAIAMSARRETANLRLALERRDVIGQAKGILMERYKLSSSQAFDLLVVASQRWHRKLRDVADELATTGELQGLTDT